MKNTTYQNLHNAARAVLRATFTVLNSYIKKEARSHVNHLALYLKELGIQQTKPRPADGRK